ncbi:MAG: aspartyl/asparaginyl beta-hydroxylase domain-containing protein [Bacteroidia bacterium]
MNNAVNNSLQLPLTLDKKKLDTDLEICLQQNWKEHFNQHDYSGEWSVIALRSQTGSQDNIYAHDMEEPYKDTPLMKKCNYFREIVTAFLFEKESVRLLRLKPGSVIHTHRDLGLAYRFDCFRIHIPVLTDAAVEFIVGGNDIPMQKGECWYADFDLPHSVKNDSAQERIHLVIDGKRNEWTDELFRSAGYDFELEKRKLKPQYDDATLNGMIEGLEKIDTDTARNMILELKKKQNENAA